MPEVLFFPYFGPNRRDDRRLVEIRVGFRPGDDALKPVDAAGLRRILETGGVIAPEDPFPLEEPPAEPRGRFANLLGQLALVLQQRAGHAVEWLRCRPRESGDAWLVLVEYLHCDVGMTAVKLALEVIQGQRRELAEPFARFAQFARERRVPAETRAIMAAARARGIPYFQLEQPPFSGAQIGGARVRPQGLLMLGHGSKAEILDGSFCLSRVSDEVRELLLSPERRAALLQSLGHAPTTEPSGPLLTVVACGSELFFPRGQAERLAPDVAQSARLVQRAVGGQAVRLDLTRGAAGLSVADFALAPDLGDLDAEDLLRAAEALLDGLFPDPRGARIPLVAITGTDGKTTTSRMTEHILRHAGFRSGLVCTDGSYIAGRRITEKDESTIQGHGRVLSHRGIDAAVLETHHRGIAVRGFAFDRVDAGICLNVTEEHIKPGEIESLEEMARIKRAVPERARNAVLFADDARCRAMLPQLDPERLWLVSLEQGPETLRSLAGNRPFCGCLIEQEEGREWLVLYEDDQRTAIMPAAAIPASFDGTARFNISNAMHAAVAARIVGVPAGTIREALEAFEAGPEMTPGRMNVYDQLPFRVIADFAHTPGGIARISEFASRQRPAGRKVLAFSGSQGRDPKVWESLGRAAAGHFDLYFCKEYPPRKDRPENRSAEHLKRGLEAGGVPEDRIRLGSYGQEQAFEIFDACTAGDLLIFLVGHTEMSQMPGFIRAYAEKTHPG